MGISYSGNTGVSPASVTAMLKRMHSKTRYSVRLAMRRGVEIEQRRPDDKAALDQFYTLMQDTAERNEFAIHSYSYYADFMRIFGDHALMLFAKVDGTVVYHMVRGRKLASIDPGA